MIDCNLQSIREKLKKKRLKLSEPEQKERSVLIANQVMQLPQYQEAENIGIYIPVRGEADPRFLYHSNVKNQKNFYLPVLSPEQDKHLWFIRWDEKTEFKTNIYGIPEPVIQENNHIDAQALDIVIMPLLSFDSSGNRLGMGGGYYDRTFAFKLSTKGRVAPLLVAYAYAFQELSKIATRAWDVPVDTIATENQSKILN